MALIPRSVDYTDKDFESIRLRLFNLIHSVFPTWTDYDTANFGNILVELFANVGDELSYYIDALGRESRISTATQRRSMIALAKLVGYEARGASAATADVVITLSSVPINDVVVSSGTRFRTAEVTDAIEFQLLASVTIPAGTNPPIGTGTCENSTTKTDTVASSGLVNQTMVLFTTPYLDGSASVTAGNGSYTEVDNFLDSGITDKHYTLSVDQNDRATIQFGNGVNGAIPTGNIVASYKTGGGVIGNVEAGRITRVVSPLTDILGSPVFATVNNANAASGGGNRESIEQMRVNVPLSVRALTRTVSREDFEIHAREIPGVGRALMLSSNEDISIPENTGKLFVIPSGGGIPSTLLKNAVFTHLTVTKPCTITFGLMVQDPVYKTVNVYAKVYLKRGYSSSTVKATILANLASFFALETTDELGNEIDNPDIDFGFNYKKNDGTAASELAWSDILNVVRDSEGVRKVEDSFNGFTLNGVQSDVAIALREFPVLGTVTLINGDNGLPL